MWYKLKFCLWIQSEKLSLQSEILLHSSTTAEDPEARDAVWSARRSVLYCPETAQVGFSDPTRCLGNAQREHAALDFILWNVEMKQTHLFLSSACLIVLSVSDPTWCLGVVHRKYAWPNLIVKYILSCFSQVQNKYPCQVMSGCRPREICLTKLNC